MGGLLYFGCPPDVGTPEAAALQKLFLNWEANPNLRYDDGKTPLHLYQSDLTLVKMLIGAGADVNAQDNFGETPLHITAETGRIAVAEILMDNDASTRSLNNKNQTPLDIAAANGHFHSFKSMFQHTTDSIRSCSHGSSKMQTEAVEKRKTAASNAYKKWRAAYDGLQSKRRQVDHEKIQKLFPEE